MRSACVSTFEHPGSSAKLQEGDRSIHERFDLMGAEVHGSLGSWVRHVLGLDEGVEFFGG